MKALLQEGGCDDTYQKHHIESHIGKRVDKQALLRGGSEGYQKQMCILLVELEVLERAIWLGSLDSWEKMQGNRGEWALTRRVLPCHTCGPHSRDPTDTECSVGQRVRTPPHNEQSGPGRNICGERVGEAGFGAEEPQKSPEIGSFHSFISLKRTEIE